MLYTPEKDQTRPDFDTFASADLNIERLWRTATLYAYRHNQKLPRRVAKIAAGYGLPEQRPANQRDMVERLLAAGFRPAQIVDLVEMSDAEFNELAHHVIHKYQLPEIVQLHEDGLTPLAISRMTGIARSKVYYHLERLGLTPHRDRSPQLTSAQEEEIIRRSEQGQTMRSIARTMGVSYPQVRRVLDSRKENQ